MCQAEFGLRKQHYCYRCKPFVFSCLDLYTVNVLMEIWDNVSMLMSEFKVYVTLDQRRQARLKIARQELPGKRPNENQSRQGRLKSSPVEKHGVFAEE
jgi:hypothetical protein